MVHHFRSSHLVIVTPDDTRIIARKNVRVKVDRKYWSAIPHFGPTLILAPGWQAPGRSITSKPEPLHVRLDA